MRSAIRFKAARAGLVAVIAWLGACSYIGGTTEPYRAKGVVASGPERGATIYARDCSWCHGSEGLGTANGPSLLEGQNGAASIDFYLSTGRMPLGTPSEPATRGEPSYSPQEIQDIVDYTRDFGAAGPEIPAIEAAAGEIGLGAELYQENCAACHSTTAVGGVLAAETAAEARSRIAPSLEGLNSSQITEAMLIGPGTMPVFGAESFGEQEYASIVRYILYLQEPDDRGGAALEHTGPVTEGAVGWIVGLGAMLVLIRWIGTKVGEE